MPVMSADGTRSGDKCSEDVCLARLQGARRDRDGSREVARGFKNETIRGTAGTEDTLVGRFRSSEEMGESKEAPFLSICLSRPSDLTGKKTRSLPFMLPYSCNIAFHVSALSVCLSH